MAAARADPAKGFLPLSKNFITVKKGNGIWKRKITYVGKSDVNRRHTKGKKVVGELTSKMHMVCSIGEAGKATFRRRAHFGCAACDNGRYNDCPEKARCGLPQVRTVLAETQNPLAYAHMKENRQTLARTAKIGDYIVVECEGGCHAPAGVNLPYDPDEFVYFDNANFVVGRVERPYLKYDGNKAPTPFGDKKKGDHLLYLMLLLPTSPGSNTFAPVGMQAVLGVGQDESNLYTDVFAEDVVHILCAEEFKIPTGARNTRACPNGGSRREMSSELKAKLLQLVAAGDGTEDE